MLYIFMYHHGNDVLSPWQPKIFMKEQERKMVIFVSFFCPQVAAHKINDIYFDNNTLHWYSNNHKNFRAKILNRFWEKLDRVQPTFSNLNFSSVDFGVFQPQGVYYKVSLFKKATNFFFMKEQEVYGFLTIRFWNFDHVTITS